jgi:hypothetical protein
MNRDSKFELPVGIERYLSALSKLYKQQGERHKLEIIVNAQVRVHEEWSSDNWNGGTYGHALYLTIPETIYVSCIDRRDELQNEIKSDLNKVHNVQNEFIEEVFIEMEAREDDDWRRNSGVLRSGERTISDSAAERIWVSGTYRVFLSHKSEVKKETAEVKKELAPFGISSFVAHEDVHPTEEWQEEIENALASMDAFVAFLTEDFHDSFWTDQEVGYAVARGVPIIAVKFGIDPYGFIGRFQALSRGWDEAPLSIVKLLIKQPRMLDAYIAALSRCSSFEDANVLANVLPEIGRLSIEQAGQLMSVFNANPDLRGSFGFRGRYPTQYGPGLAKYLTRATGQQYVITTSGEMKRAKDITVGNSRK